VQGGFHKYRSCVLKIQTLHNVIEDALSNKRSLYILFIDFEQVFDSISHEALFQALNKIGCTNEIIKHIKNLYENAYSDIITGAEVTKPVRILRGS
jgi:hypothetical protein